MNRGQLKKWNDDRGFGFIRPDDGSPDVFLHISDLPQTIRRPRIGDRVTYHLGRSKDGKLKATKASLEGVPAISNVQPSPQPRSYGSTGSTQGQTRRKPKNGLKTAWKGTVLGIAAIGAVVAAFNQFSSQLRPATVQSNATPTAPAPISATPQAPKATPATPKPVVTPRPAATPEPTQQNVTVVRVPASSTGSGQAPAGCNVKGNVSYDSGEKLYHVPGMEDYEGTKIDPDRGERWFCSEEEAIAAGWRKGPG
ncbi:MAG: cold shock domain-containing protein [Prochlorothrix sp.]